MGNTLIALNPTSKSVFFTCRTINKTMQTISGSTVCAAAHSDCASGDALSGAFAKLGSAASLGVVLGPLMGAAMLGRGFTPSAVYYMQVFSGLIHSVLLAAFLQETLPTNERAPCSGLKNPFAFLKLFQRGKKLSLLCASCGFSCFADGGNLNDIEQIWIANDVTDMGLFANSLYLLR